MLLRSWSDDIGDLFKVYRQGGRYFIETITPAREPGAGKVSRRYVSKQEALDFDPDPAEELEYYSVFA